MVADIFAARYDGGGSVVNQVQKAYNGLDQLTAEYQGHGGAVNTASTPAVQYAYSYPSIGSGLLSMTFPNGRVLHYGCHEAVEVNGVVYDILHPQGIKYSEWSKKFMTKFGPPTFSTEPIK